MGIVISEGTKARLLELARESIKAHLEGRDPRLPPLPGDLDVRCGAFVTLKKRGELRGCIGLMSSELFIADTIQRMAVAAAFEDDRFMPVRASELPELDIEISVLTPLEPSTPDKVTVGTHGIYLRRGARAGVLLPQVPTEYGWDHDTYLSHGCRKAGLPPDAWRESSTELLTFEAIVFGERERATH